MKVDAAELAAAAVAGLVLAYAADRTPSLRRQPVATAALLYTLGFYVATQRPFGGFLRLSTQDPLGLKAKGVR